MFKIRNKSGMVLDHIPKWNKYDIGLPSEEEWRLQTMDYLISNYRYLEVDNYEQAKQVRRIYPNFEGIVYWGVDFLIIPPKKLGSDHFLKMGDSAILKSWKSYNAGASQKESLNKAKMRAEAWRIYVNTQCV